MNPPIADPPQVLQFMIDKGAELGLGGRARVAREGVNCTISGTQVRPAPLPFA
jgi:predicted sulfurtransferase